jgi:transcriptional regulator with XRE-family HTH domain
MRRPPVKPDPSHAATVVKVNDIATLGRVVRERRRALGVIQAEAAGLIGVDRAVVGRLERGRNVHLSIALALVQVLGMDVEIRPRGGTR